MPGYISQWWDSLTKKYKEVSKEDPFPVTMVGSSGSSDVTITGSGGDAATGEGSATIPPTNVGLDNNSKVYGFGATDWERINSTGNSLHVVQQGALPAGTNTIGNVGMTSVPTIGTHGNAWNAAVVLANGESASVDIQYVYDILIFGNAGAATEIDFLFSQDNTNFYSNDSGNMNSITLSAAGDFAFYVPIGARYMKLRSTQPTTITATIAGKG